MEEKNKEILLSIFANALESKTYGQDNNKIMYVCNLLKDMEQKLPTHDEIEKAKEYVTDLEIKSLCTRICVIIIITIYCIIV